MVCTRGRTVLATVFEPRHDLGLYGGLLLELYALACGSCTCGMTVKSAAVAIVRDARLRPHRKRTGGPEVISRVQCGVRRSSLVHWTCQTDVLSRSIVAWARHYRLKITIPPLTSISTQKPLQAPSLICDASGSFAGRSEGLLGNPTVVSAWAGLQPA